MTHNSIGNTLMRSVVSDQWSQRSISFNLHPTARALIKGCMHRWTLHSKLGCWVSQIWADHQHLLIPIIRWDNQYKSSDHMKQDTAHLTNIKKCHIQEVLEPFNKEQKRHLEPNKKWCMDHDSTAQTDSKEKQKRTQTPLQVPAHLCCRWSHWAAC